MRSEGSMPQRRVWLYKCNARGEKYQTGVGDWRDFFRRPGDGRWGGVWSTKNPKSRQIFSELMKPEDFVLCYQTDRREILGVCRVVGFVNVSKGFRKGRNVVLSPLEEFHRPVKIHALKREIPVLKMIRALQPGWIQTVYELSDEEGQVLLSACGSRFAVAVKPGGRRKTTISTSKPAGGGFGSAVENKAVEQRAIGHVSRWYRGRGWKVVSRERENIGYDLECIKSGREIHVEVKGTQGAGDSFPMTNLEYRLMGIDPHFVLAVVGNALSGRPVLKRWKGLDALKRFHFRAVTWLASAEQR